MHRYGRGCSSRSIRILCPYCHTQGIRQVQFVHYWVLVCYSCGTEDQCRMLFSTQPGWPKTNPRLHPVVRKIVDILKKVSCHS